jgi:hypothetical protein
MWIIFIFIINNICFLKFTRQERAYENCIFIEVNFQSSIEIDEVYIYFH